MLNTLHYITCLLLLINCVAMVIIYRQLPLAFKLLMAQTITAILVEVTAMQLKQHGYKNVPLFNVYLLLEVFFLLLALKYWQAPLTKFLSLFYLLFLGLWLFSIYRNTINHFAQNAFLISSFIICFLYLLFIIKLYTSNARLLTDPVFWTALGILFYFSGTIPLFSLFDYLISNTFIHSAKNLYAINGILAIVRYGFYFIGVLFIYKKRDNISAHTHDYTHTI